MQTWAAKKAAEYLSDKLHTTVSIESLYIKPFSSVVLQNFYVLDKQKDTLVSTPNLLVNLNGFSIFSSIKKRAIDFKLIQLDNGSFYLKNQKDGHTNLQFIINYFNSPDTSKTVSKPWKLILETIAINKFHFRYKDFNIPDTVVNQVNFDDIDVKNFSAVIKDIDFKKHLFKGNITNLTLQEKSGFYLKKINALATVDSNQIVAKNLVIITNHSHLKNYFRMKFKNFSDIGHHINDRVFLDGDFHSSFISSTDVAYFTNSLTKIRFDLGLDGRIRGFVNNLKAKNLLITGAKATYIKGNFNLTGLPNWDKTVMNLKFEQLATNQADLDFLYSRFTGTANSHVPTLFSKFGYINFTGQFVGKQHDFIASGTIKTKLGRFDPVLSLKMEKNSAPVYDLKMDTYAFDVGALTDQENIGRVTMHVSAVGTGFSANELNTKFDATIAELSFNGYNYKNLSGSGTFANKVADGLVTIDDKNIKLNLKGNANFSGSLPVYDLSAFVENAQLNNLNFTKDTLRFSSTIKSKFYGDDLTNLTGNIFFNQPKLIAPHHALEMDTLSVTADGTGNLRTITLKSDVANGYIKGGFDLATLPSYFKTVIKKYVPSYKTVLVEPKAQNFDFRLNLKNPDSLIAFFNSKLKIPDQGTLVGKFNSETQTETLNVYIKTIQLGKTVFHDFIMDESTYKDYLGLNVSLSKIDLTDSLFIKDITINNNLKHDSLDFNLKLSDQNAVNSLDLYGLVNFGKDTVATIQLLPSDVNLEQEDWKIADKVRIRFLTGKTEISGFELSHGQQKVKIDGLISEDPADVLKLTFEKFSMATFNQLTKRQENSKLKGMLYGDVKFTELLKSPGIEANLNIDSLKVNKTDIGNVKINSGLGPDRKKADLSVTVNNHGMETVSIGGTYEIGHGVDDYLNFDVKLNHTQGIIFEPFINDLVSNIKGNVSTNLKISGPPSWPQINGEIILSDASVTVNYLKTAYKVNDTLKVNSSVINISNLLIRDFKGGTGSVSGTIDLNDISNPDIEVVLTAKKLLALNTSYKDNHLYYGTAFASGRFSFSGPPKNMNIDIKASADEGTVFNIPLNTSTTVSDNDFIHFVSHRDTTKKLEKAHAFNGLTLNLDLSADEKSTVRITTDYGILEGQGKTNNLILKINSLGDFEMFGSYMITTGKFDFTAKNFISKNFVVQQGGTIIWTGNPANASINLNAIYEVRTSVAPLYTAAGSTSPKTRAQELVQAELLLSKSLLQPDIDFNFNFPLNPSINEDLSNYLSDNNNRSQQALSIILRRQFSSSATNESLDQQVTNTATEVTSEFIFNKINTFISQTNIKGLDFNIRSFNDFSASLHLKDRLILTGSLFNNTPTTGPNSGLVGNTDFTSSVFNSNFNTLTKDFDIQYLIKKDGNLRARYSYRVLNSSTLSTLSNQLNDDYVNGVGLIFQRDFDSIGELINSVISRQSSKKSPAKILLPVTSTNLPEKPKEEDQ